MANVGRISSLAPVMEKLISESNSVENVSEDCKSSYSNLHEDVKWRSFKILSKDTLVKIIEVLLNEIESSKLLQQQQKNSSGTVQNSQAEETGAISQDCEKKIKYKPPTKTCKVDRSQGCSFEKDNLKIEGNTETKKESSWTEVKRKRYLTNNQDLAVNQITQESLPQVANVRKSNRYKLRLCPYCRSKHRVGQDFCKAFGKYCRICEKKNHFAKACWWVKDSSRSKESLKVEQSKGHVEEDDNQLLESIDVAKETKECNSLEESAETTTEENALHWINMRLKTNHLTLEELSDGESLQNLLNKCCFAGKEYSRQGSDPWSLINHHLDLEDSTDYYDVELMKKGNTGGFFYFAPL